ALTTASIIEVPVQINGKLRSRIMVPAGADLDTCKSTALADERVQELLEGKTIVKAIVVPGKLVNFVIR
ncbi:MAG TPA: hypothetical protein PKA06_13445, partial [Gemmatales bacterium]|nr:hypothetical protein [Gemmatales bacterium]